MHARPPALGADLVDQGIAGRIAHVRRVCAAGPGGEHLLAEQEHRILEAHLLPAGLLGDLFAVELHHLAELFVLGGGHLQDHPPPEGRQAVASLPRSISASVPGIAGLPPELFGGPLRGEAQPLLFGVRRCHLRDGPQRRPADLSRDERLEAARQAIESPRHLDQRIGLRPPEAEGLVGIGRHGGKAQVEEIATVLEDAQRLGEGQAPAVADAVSFYGMQVELLGRQGGGSWSASR